MLPRLILLTLLAVGGLQAVSVSQQPNLLGLRRFVDRVQRVDSNSAVGDTCTGVGCASGNESELEARSLGLKEIDDDEEDEDGAGDEGDEETEDDGTAVEEGNFSKIWSVCELSCFFFNQEQILL